MDLSVDEIIKQKYKNPNCLVNGFAIPSNYLKAKHEIDNFECFNSDTFICTFPKTGTTWAQEMTWLIANGVNFEAAKVDLFMRCSFLEISIHFSENSENAEVPVHIADSINFCKNLNHPRFIKTHLPHNLLPKEIQNATKKPKIIYVTRNPKDVCTSFYHHHVLFEDFTGNFEEFCKLFLEEDKVMYNPYYKHVRGFVDNKKDLNILFLKFEDMKKDLVSVIKEVADFLEVKLTNDQIDNLKEHLSFESMKVNPYVNKELHIKHFNYKGHFMRSGKIGTYVDDMSEDMVKKFNIWIKENFKGLEEYICF